MIGYYTPYLFIVKTATLERSIPKETAVFYLSVIGNRESVRNSSDTGTRHNPTSYLCTGFSNTAARFLSGWITKLPYMSPLLVNNIGLTVAGIATLLVPLCQTNGLLIAYCLVWGGFIGRVFQPFLRCDRCIVRSSLSRVSESRDYLRHRRP